MRRLGRRVVGADGGDGGDLGDAGRERGTTTGPTSGGSAGGSTGSGEGSGGASATEASATEAVTSSDPNQPKLDLAVADFGAQPGDGCTKVDFLFVLDNSISMGDEQMNLAASFPGFISTIQSMVKAQDYHIMVIDTDDMDKWGEKWERSG